MCLFPYVALSFTHINGIEFLASKIVWAPYWLMYWKKIKLQYRTSGHLFHGLSLLTEISTCVIFTAISDIWPTDGLIYWHETTAFRRRIILAMIYGQLLYLHNCWIYKDYFVNIRHVLFLRIRNYIPTIPLKNPSKVIVGQLRRKMRKLVVGEVSIYLE